MGTDIFLWVETLDPDGRYRAVNEDGALGDPSAHALEASWSYKRDRYEFTLLGAEMNCGPFPPIVPIRDLPIDCWPPICEWMFESRFLSASWFTAAELQDVDWTARVPHRTYASNALIVPFDERDVQPFHDLDDRSLDVIRAVLWPVGWAESDADEMPCVGDLSLARAAAGLHALMLKMVALNPAEPQTTRAVYAFDQLPVPGRPLPGQSNL